MAVFWIQKPVGYPAVVGQNYQSFGILVQTPQRKKFFLELRLDLVGDRTFTSLRGVSHNLFRFIVSDIDEVLGRPCYGSYLIPRMHLIAKTGTSSVYFYFSGTNQLVGLAARGDSPKR